MNQTLKNIVGRPAESKRISKQSLISGVRKKYPGIKKKKKKKITKLFPAVFGLVPAAG